MRYITWRWDTNGEYLTHNAYLAHFIGGVSMLKITPIWRVRAEPTSREPCFIGKFLYYEKLLT